MQDDVFLYLKRELWDKKNIAEAEPASKVRLDWGKHYSPPVQPIRLIFDKAIPWNSVRNDLGLVKRD